MNRQTIEQAADNYAANATPSYTNGDFDRNAIAEAFEAGVEWLVDYLHEYCQDKLKKEGKENEHD